MTKERLRKYRAIKRERDHIHAKIEEIETLLYGLRSPQISGMPRGGNETRDDRRDSLIQRKSDLQALYKQKEAELDMEILAIEAAISSLPNPTERMLMRLYYIDGLTWEEICVQIHYGWTQTHKYHAAALRKLKTQEIEEEE